MRTTLGVLVCSGFIVALARTAWWSWRTEHDRVGAGICLALVTVCLLAIVGFVAR